MPSTPMARIEHGHMTRIRPIPIAICDPNERHASLRAQLFMQVFAAGVFAGASQAVVAGRRTGVDPVQHLHSRRCRCVAWQFVHAEPDCAAVERAGRTFVPALENPSAVNVNLFLSAVPPERLALALTIDGGCRVVSRNTVLTPSSSSGRSSGCPAQRCRLVPSVLGRTEHAGAVADRRHISRLHQGDHLVGGRDRRLPRNRFVKLGRAIATRMAMTTTVTISSTRVNPGMAKGPVIVRLRCSISLPRMRSRTYRTQTRATIHARRAGDSGAGRCLSHTPDRHNRNNPQMGEHDVHMIVRATSRKSWNSTCLTAVPSTPCSALHPDHRGAGRRGTGADAGTGIGTTGCADAAVGLASLGIQWIALGTLCALYLFRRWLWGLSPSILAWTCLGLLLAMTLLVASAAWALLDLGTQQERAPCPSSCACWPSPWWWACWPCWRSRTIPRPRDWLCAPSNWNWNR